MSAEDFDESGKILMRTGHLSLRKMEELRKEAIQNYVKATGIKVTQ